MRVAIKTTAMRSDAHTGVLQPKCRRGREALDETMVIFDMGEGNCYDLFMSTWLGIPQLMRFPEMPALRFTFWMEAERTGVLLLPVYRQLAGYQTVSNSLLNFLASVICRWTVSIVVTTMPRGAPISYGGI